MAQIVFLVLSLEMVQEVQDVMMDRVDEAAASQNLDPAVGDVLREIASRDTTDNFRVFMIAVTGVAIVYPFVAFLVLLLSRSVREALRAARLERKPDAL